MAPGGQVCISQGPTREEEPVRGIGLCDCRVWRGRSEICRANWQAGNPQATADLQSTEFLLSLGNFSLALKADVLHYQR